jgi:hypothetical protein
MPILSELLRKWHPHYNDLADLEQAADALDEAVEAMEAARNQLRYPPNGYHVCRWCGYHHSSQGHSPYCGYVEQCNSIDTAEAALTAAIAKCKEDTNADT